MCAESYRSAGVDIDACDSWLDRLRSSVPAIGGFSGLCPIPKEVLSMERPCFVAGTDGVGTKLLVALAAKDLTTIGIDCVAMVVNDLICCGAQPLFFLDYLAVGKFDPAQANDVLSGILRGCEEAGCSLIGGETAELPGLLNAGVFDVAGFGVGIVDGARAWTGEHASVGDCVIGVASSGLHSNGYSLARKLFPEYQSDPSVAQRLLTPTRIYAKPLLSVAKQFSSESASEEGPIRAVAHITGGGIPANLQRVLPAGLGADVYVERCEPDSIFEELRGRGDLSPAEFSQTFNRGIGLCMVVRRECAEDVLRAWRDAEGGNCHAWIIGEVVERDNAGAPAVRIIE